jgi:uncharacterized protein
MQKSEIIEKTKAYVKNHLEGESSGHDWWHIYRVWKLALHIAQQEEVVDLFIVQIAALLHDIGDPKLHGGDTTVAPRLIGAWLKKVGIVGEDREHIMHIIGHMSFSKHLGGKHVEKSKEFMIVQDADRLDAIGSVGIGRTFAYGGNKGITMHDPTVSVRKKVSAEQYHGTGGSTVNHFYEKLFLLKDLMNTKTAKKMAEQRHQFMENFLSQFYDEWEGKI